MSSNEQARSNDKANPKQQPPQPVTTAELSPLEQPLHTDLILQQARLDPRALSPRDVLQLQRTIGNRAVASLFSIQRDKDDDAATTPAPAPAPTWTKPRDISVSLGSFSTPQATLDKAGVHVTGRMSVSGKASLLNEELPKKESEAKKALQARVQTLLLDALNAATPTGTATKIEVPLAGETLLLELEESAIWSPDFQVAGRFSAKGRDLTLAGCEVKGATISLNVLAWLAPKPPPGPAPDPIPTPDDMTIKQFSFAGDSAKFADKKNKKDKKEKERSGSVSLKSSLDDFEARVPDFVKSHAFLQRPDQRTAFFQHMRSYFGTDDKTLDHFAKMRKANVKGATTWLHDEAATRLEKVQAEIGEANMPSSGGVGWPRSECTLASQQDLGNLHNIGFAVDYNAYQTPHIKDQRTLDLISVVTGRSATATYGSPEGLDTRKVGDTFTHGTDEEKEKLEADPRLQAWLERVGKEAESVGKASEDFRSSLKSADDKGAVIDLAPQLQALRQEWFLAKTADEKAAVLAKLQNVLKPWLDKVAAQKLSMETKIKAVGLDPATLPTGDALKAASAATKKLAPRLNKFVSKLGPDLKKGQRAEVNKLITEARKLLGESGVTPTEDAEAVAELRRLTTVVEQREDALVQKAWLDRMTTLHSALTSDGSFVFGTALENKLAPKIKKSLDKFGPTLKKGQRKEVDKLIGEARKFLDETGVTPTEDADAVAELRRLQGLVEKRHTPKKEVGNPALAQIVDIGFFNLQGKAKAGKEAFNVDFVKSMVKHGFNHGATWSTPDLMHFELRWSGPGQ